MKSFHTTTLIGLLLPLTSLAAGAQTVDKSAFNLFNPVPEDQLRPLSSETYDGFTDARTLDAGHVQVEGDFINYSWHSSQEYNSYASWRLSNDAFSWDPRISAGLLNNVDIFVRPSYAITSYREKGSFNAGGGFDYTGSFSRFGPVTTGVKINLWGNDGGTTALAIRPYLVIPTDGGDVMGGSDLALLVRLPHDFSLHVDSEFYSTENDNGTLYAGFDNGVSLDKNLCSKANAYWYLDSAVTSDPSQPWAGSTGFGLEYNFTRNLQLFGGIGFGLTSASGDYNPRCGFVWRF